MNCGPQKCSLALAGGPDADLRPSSLRFSIANGLRLSPSVFFLISLAVCRLPLFCSACRGQRTESSFKQESAARCSEEERRRSPDSHLGQEPSEVSPHVGQHLLLLGLVIGPLLGLFVLLPLSLLLRERKKCLQLVVRAGFPPLGGAPSSEQLVDRRRGFSSICSTMSKR